MCRYSRRTSVPRTSICSWNARALIRSASPGTWTSAPIEALLPDRTGSPIIALVAGRGHSIVAPYCRDHQRDHPAQREMHLQDRLIGLEQHLAVFQSAGLHAR